jgi:hypothetical protein
MTPVGDMVKSFAARHAMVSYAHPEQMEVAAEICQSVVLDNGAFSAWRAEKEYDFAGFAMWAEKWVRHPAVDWCIIPDVIGGTEQKNDDLLLLWSLPDHLSVPVFHMHESLSRLAMLVERYPRVALGSSGDFATVGTKKWWHRMHEMMTVACDAKGVPKTKLHGLRMLNPGVFSKLPLASADSCNVARNIGYDSRWTGSYLPASKATKALILMERIERHASAALWTSDMIDEYHNDVLLG